MTKVHKGMLTHLCLIQDYDCYGGLLKKKLGLPTMMPDWEKDYLAGRKALEMKDLQVFEAPIHIEGGSIHSDGQGWDIFRRSGVAVFETPL